MRNRGNSELHQFCGSTSSTKSNRELTRLDPPSHLCVGRLSQLWCYCCALKSPEACSSWHALFVQALEDDRRGCCATNNNLKDE